MSDQREILFRGFHPCEGGGTTIYVEGKAVNGRWVEGGYAEIAPPPVCFSSDPQEPTKVCIVVEQGFADWGMPRRYGMCDVLPSTVCQYIGLADKNGRKIFEGDVVKFNGREFTIAWIDKYARFAGTKPGVIFASFLFQSSEVTGTIWDKEEA